MEEPLVNRETNGNGVERLNSANNDLSACGKSSLAYSLAYFPTTPPWFRILIGGLTLLAHGMFLYGQLLPMWRLHAKADVDIWVNATSLYSRLIIGQLGLSDSNHVLVDTSTDISTFTYISAISTLWKAHNLDNVIIPRLAAVLLVIFSGFWPHVKLILLNFLWLTKQHEFPRTRGFYWLSTFGKWSLADVFVVCIMIGVFSLNAKFIATKIQSKIMEDIPMFISTLNSTYSPKQLCALILKSACDSSNLIDEVKCLSCRETVSEAFTHPDWATAIGQKFVSDLSTSGDGVAKLEIAGLHGIYVFCFAAILSLVLSTLVELMDHRAKGLTAMNRLASIRTSGQDNLVAEDRHSENYSNGTIECLPGMMHDETIGNGCHQKQVPVFLFSRLPAGALSRKSYFLLLVLAAAALTSIIFGIVVPAMQCTISGAIPDAFASFVELEKTRSYSLWSLMKATGAAGGYDFLLMLIFAIFVIFGPLLRSASVLLGFSLPFTSLLHKRFVQFAFFTGAFCAWEVMLIAFMLVHMEMPSITDTIVELPECALVNPDGVCLELGLTVQPGGFILVILGTILLLVVATAFIRIGYRTLDIYHDGDTGGPYCFKWCGSPGDRMNKNGVAANQNAEEVVQYLVEESD